MGHRKCRKSRGGFQTGWELEPLPATPYPTWMALDPSRFDQASVSSWVNGGGHQFFTGMLGGRTVTLPLSLHLLWATVSPYLYGLMYSSPRSCPLRIAHEQRENVGDIIFFFKRGCFCHFHTHPPPPKQKASPLHPESPFNSFTLFQVT